MDWWLIVWLVDWLINWLIGWLISLIDGMIDWLSCLGWLVDDHFIAAAIDCYYWYRDPRCGLQSVGQMGKWWKKSIQTKAETNVLSRVRYQYRVLFVLPFLFLSLFLYFFVIFCFLFRILFFSSRFRRPCPLELVSGHAGGSMPACSSRGYPMWRKPRRLCSLWRRGFSSKLPSILGGWRPALRGDLLMVWSDMMWHDMRSNDFIWRDLTRSDMIWGDLKSFDLILSDVTCKDQTQAPSWCRRPTSSLTSALRKAVLYL